MKVAYKKQPKDGHHVEEPTVLHSLERRIKQCRQSVPLEWKSSIVHDMMLVDACKSPTWSKEVSDDDVMRMEIKGAGSCRVEAAINQALGPPEVCERVFVSDGELTLDLSNSRLEGFDASPIVQVLLWNAEKASLHTIPSRVLRWDKGKAGRQV